METRRQPDLRAPRPGHRGRAYTSLAGLYGRAYGRVVLVGPGRFAELASDVGVASPGDRTPVLAQPGRVLRAGEPGERHEGTCPREAAPVEDLSPQAQTSHVRDAPISAET